MTTADQITAYRAYAAKEVMEEREPKLFSEWREANQIETTEQEDDHPTRNINEDDPRKGER